MKKWRLVEYCQYYRSKLIVRSFLSRFNMILKSFEEVLKCSWQFWKSYVKVPQSSNSSDSSDAVLSFLLFILFPGGKHNCLHAKSKYKQGKVLSKSIASKVRVPTLAGNKHLFHPSLPSQDAPFPSFERKWTGLVRQRWASKCLFPRRHLCLQL